MTRLFLLGCAAAGLCSGQTTMIEATLQPHGSQYLLHVQPNVRQVRVLYEIANGTHQVQVFEPKAPDTVIGPTQAEGMTVVATIDSITLADGSWKGPDTTKIHARIEARERALAAFYRECEHNATHMPSGEFKAWLQRQIDANTDQPGKFAHADFARTAVRGAATGAQLMLSKQGAAAVEQMAAAQSKGGAK